MNSEGLTHDSLLKRIRYLLARNATLETDVQFTPLIPLADTIPTHLLSEVAAFLEQEEVDLLAQLNGLEEPPEKFARGAEWMIKQLETQTISV